MTTTVRHLMTMKHDDLWTVDEACSVFDALKLMAEKDIGSVVVTREDGICGIMSERDYARKVILEGKASRTTPVAEIMTGEVLAVRPEQTLEECMGLMTNKRTRHLLVREDDQVLGIISIGDVVKAIISDQEFLLEQLESYIMGPGVGAR